MVEYNTKKTIRWAICGTGNITQKFLQAIGQLDCYQVVACASSSKARAIEFGLQHGLKPFTYQELYEANDIDAVYVCTNNNFHYENVLGCLKNCKPVLCEKPFATNSKQTQEMIQLAKGNQVLLMEAMWTVFLPCTMQVKELALSKKLGKIVKINGKFAIPHLENKAHRVHNANLGGGVLLDLGVYFASYAYNILGYPQSIQAGTPVFVNGVDLHTKMMFEYKDVTCNFECMLSQGRDSFFDIALEDGRIFVNAFNGATQFDVIDKDGKTTTHICEDADNNGFVPQIQHFCNLLKTGKKQSDIWSLESTQKVMDILTECKGQLTL